MQHETFYVLAANKEDLQKIANHPVCFSPISYKQEIVDPGDIPTHAKIVVVNQKDGRIKRVNLETALHMSSGEEIDAVNEITAAIDTLKAAMQRNGLNAPISIELQDAHQALKLASLFGDKLTTRSFARLVTSVFSSKSDFMIRGIKFTWQRSKQGFSRFRAITGGRSGR
jgi:hypothetical protein